LASRTRGGRIRAYPGTRAPLTPGPSPARGEGSLRRGGKRTRRLRRRPTFITHHLPCQPLCHDFRARSPPDSAIGRLGAGSVGSAGDGRNPLERALGSAPSAFSTRRVRPEHAATAALLLGWTRAAGDDAGCLGLAGLWRSLARLSRTAAPGRSDGRSGLPWSAHAGDPGRAPRHASSVAGSAGD